MGQINMIKKESLNIFMVLVKAGDIYKIAI